MYRGRGGGASVDSTLLQLTRIPDISGGPHDASAHRSTRHISRPRHGQRSGRGRTGFHCPCSPGGSPSQPTSGRSPSQRAARSGHACRIGTVTPSAHLVRARKRRQRLPAPRGRPDPVRRPQLLRGSNRIVDRHVPHPPRPADSRRDPEQPGRPLPHAGFCWRDADALRRLRRPAAVELARAARRKVQDPLWTRAPAGRSRSHHAGARPHRRHRPRPRPRDFGARQLRRRLPPRQRRASHHRGSDRLPLRPGGPERRPGRRERQLRYEQRERPRRPRLRAALSDDEPPRRAGPGPRRRRELRAPARQCHELRPAHLLDPRAEHLLHLPAQRGRLRLPHAGHAAALLPRRADSEFSASTSGLKSP